MKCFQILKLSVLCFILSCNKDQKPTFNQQELDSLIVDLKQRDLIEIKNEAKLKTIDSLSKYEISGMSKFIDSLKATDSVNYFALRKVVENDTISYFDDYKYMSLFTVGIKMKSESDYMEEAKKILLKK